MKTWIVDIVFGIILLAVVLVATCCGAERPEFNEVRLVVAVDGSPNCQTMLPILGKLREGGNLVSVVDIRNPKVKSHLEGFELQRVKEMPRYLMLIGHETWEMCQGLISLRGLEAWCDRAAQGQKTGPEGIERLVLVQEPQQQREYLQDAPENKVYLRKRMGPSCGMLWCQNPSHWYEIKEWVDSQGNVVGRE
jgi:hypothetical protein